MQSNILCTLLAQRIPPEQFQLHGLEVHWMDEVFNTPENQIIINDVIANYDTLAAYEIALKAWEKEIAEYDIVMPRHMEDHITDMHNGNVSNPYGQDKYDQKKLKRANKPVK
jgi:hypothetical protein